MNFDIGPLALEIIMSYLDDPRDRDTLSLVNRDWYDAESNTRKHVTIALCYTTTPGRLRDRFRFLESLKLKGKPRAAMFNLIPEDWGGYAGPWIREFSEGFNRLKSLHFRRMVVVDEDIEVLVGACGHMMESLMLDKCSGFSTNGLLRVARTCRSLKILFLEESIIVENDGQWLHELALNNAVLETLNFYMTYLTRISVQDLELIAQNCKSLVSVKISDCETLDLINLINFFQAATALEEFGGGSLSEQPEGYGAVLLPPRLCRVGLSYMGNDEMPIIFPRAHLLKKLDLLCSLLNTEDHCLLIQQCPNLEILETRNVIGDVGLQVLAQHCQRLKRLRIERGADDGMEDESGFVTQTGLSALAQGCVKLEYIAVYVSDITNASLECIGTHCRNLCDFRLVLLERETQITDLPLDNGVRALLRGCERIRRFALYLRAGGLTDVGLRYIGQYSINVRWMLLGYVGESDTGLMDLARGCPNIQKLELRGCYFSELTIARAVLELRSLRYLWVQGYRATTNGSDLAEMVRAFWNIEFIPPRRVIVGEGEPILHPAQALAYYSLAGPRTDYPQSVSPLDPYIDP